MKKSILFRSFSMFLTACLSTVIFAQTDIILDPSQLIPADTGYYIGGVWLDENEDGVPEFYNQCLDYYGDASHNEDGVQQGFTYNDCMIMPTCWPKDAVDDNSLAEIDHAEGYIELTKTKYFGTDSARLGYIITPRIKNLVSLTLETSPDVSSNDSRKIKFWLEYSKDNGATWENAFIEDETLTKKGDVRTYDGSVFLEFGDMKTASQTAPIIIRIMSKPEIADVYSSQRVKIHWVKVVAELAPDSKDDNFYKNPVNIRVFERTISVINDRLVVYSLTGQKIGSGEAVDVKNQGIYLVKTESGTVHKVYVK